MPWQTLGLSQESTILVRAQLEKPNEKRRRPKIDGQYINVRKAPGRPKSIEVEVVLASWREYLY